MTKSTALRALVALATIFTMLGAGSAGAEPPDRASELAAYWTPQRMADAIPRDLVVDQRGFGYLSLPDGSLQPYGHDVAANQLRAVPSASPRKGPPGGSSGSDDTTPPVISNLDPDGITIGSSYTFEATVTDDFGVKSVTFVITYPDGVTTQSFNPSSSGDVWSITLQGFSNGNWSWTVEAKDTAKRGGNTASDSAPFTVDTGGTPQPPPPSGDVVTDADWTYGGAVDSAAGRIYFEMPRNASRNGPWVGYVCSGTVATDALSGRSVVITAAHCVYDDANKAFARNVLFIPKQYATSGSGTDLNCGNDPYGCWAPSFGVVDQDWTTRTFPDNIPWDFAYYVFDDNGSHSGAGTGGALDATVGSLDPVFNSHVLGDVADALGYSYSQDPDFRYCSEPLGTESSYGDLWLSQCDLSGGSSGGPWLQPAGDGNGDIISVNSWGYTNSPGMAGPILDSQASCLFTAAKGTAFFTASDGNEGVHPNC